MIQSIKDEFEEFKQYHKNIYNIFFHIFCGVIFMAAFFLLFGKNSFFTLFLYTILMIITLNDIYLSAIICTVVFILMNVILVPRSYLLAIFIGFYLLPDLSHFLTAEPAMLNINNITFLNAMTNIFYLLPFSIMCLPNAR